MILLLQTLLMTMTMVMTVNDDDDVHHHDYDSNNKNIMIIIKIFSSYEFVVQRTNNPLIQCQLLILLKTH